MSWVLRGRWQDPGKLLVSFGRKRVTFKGYAKGHTNQHLCTLEPVAWVHGIGGRAWLWVSPGEEIQYTEIRWSVERRTGPKWVERRRVPSACFTPSRPQRVCYAPSPAPPPTPGRWLRTLQGPLSTPLAESHIPEQHVSSQAHKVCTSKWSQRENLGSGCTFLRRGGGGERPLGRSKLLCWGTFKLTQS